ncbi:MAG: T9SS type A sorting domain-containing protein [Sphingobacteriales bacterium]|nr:T9SS type A sorting domain-containing protein [Sphingobacteriales bacterium]MBP9140106.1 T9SS type A sorting domain-containing protein [Chitinophagales bacterium]MDA0198220.1 T9SS type A sorting domain-containing protein [Bacteroidota bacterium]
MGRFFIGLILITASSTLLLNTAKANSTFEAIYKNVFVAQCGSCHAPGNMQANLDLVGEGSNAMANVRANLYMKPVKNTTAKAKNNLLVYSGDPYRSLLFRLVNNGLAADVVVEPSEDVDNIHANIKLKDTDKELIRQWILFDAPATGYVIDHSMIESFYSGNGIWGIDASEIPEPPAPGEGFQIHYGPFFLPPWEDADQPNAEYRLKYDTKLPTDIEINRIEAAIGSSHHFIMYRFTEDAKDVPYGLRNNDMDTQSEYVAGWQFSNNLLLPEGTAYKWAKNSQLDLNAHVINYSQTAIVANDMYINVYTQPKGTAKQEMFSALIPNITLYLPNTGQEEEIETFFNLNQNATIHIWRMSSHTHKLATDFDVWLRNADGTKNEHIFDATKYNGVPTCEEIGYDYQHPPTRSFAPFLPLNIKNGIIHRAKYLNNSNKPVFWGPTSNDEMMITAIFYTLSTDGIEMTENSDCAEVGINEQNFTSDSANTNLNLQVLNSAATAQTTLNLSAKQAGRANLQVFDVNGRQIWETSISLLGGNTQQQITLPTHNLGKGVYWCRAANEQGQAVNQKFIVY